MKKKQKFGLGVFILGIVFTTVFFIKSNQKGLIEYEIAKPVITNITNQIVATGNKTSNHRNYWKNPN